MLSFAIGKGPCLETLERILNADASPIAQSFVCKLFQTARVDGEHLSEISDINFRRRMVRLVLESYFTRVEAREDLPPASRSYLRNALTRVMREKAGLGKSRL